MIKLVESVTITVLNVQDQVMPVIHVLMYQEVQLLHVHVLMDIMIM
jgi:hypothetical protein